MHAAAHNTFTFNAISFRDQRCGPSDEAASQWQNAVAAA
jgi:hypothetical protein